MSEPAGYAVEVDPAEVAKLEAELDAASVPPVDPRRRIDALNALSWALRASGNLRAHELARKAHGESVACGYKLGQARSARTMAMTIREEDDLLTLFDLAHEAKELFDEVGDDYGRAGSRDFLASILEFTGDLTAALEYALDALVIAREIRDPVRQGYALSSIGGILTAAGDHETAVDRLKEALDLFEAVHDENGIRTICSRLSRVLRAAGRPDEALGYALRVRDSAVAAKDEWSYATALTVMAEIEDARSHPDTARGLYRAALASLVHEKARSIAGSEILLSFGKFLIRQSDFETAETELQDALQRITGDGVSMLTEAAIRETLAELKERKGDLKATVMHLKEARRLREQVARNDAKNKRQQVEIRASMEAAKKDAEHHRLRFAELHAMQAKLVEAKKSAILGQLAAGTAHELNSPLGVLRSNAELSATTTERLLSLAPREAPEAQQLARILESCRQTTDEAVERIGAIATSFKRFSQLDQAERRSFDVREGLESALALLRPSVPPGVTIERRLDEVPTILGWPRELNHAFMTVLQNAVQAIEDSGRVTVETATTDREVIVRIRDDGRGMSSDEVGHLFDVSWSKEGARTQMRLGLSAAYATMTKHGGDLEAQSTVKKGTVITFRFPIPSPPPD